MDKSESILEPSQIACKRLKAINIDPDLLKVFLEYATAKIDVQIQVTRNALKNVSEASLRQEYLARIDSLQLVKSGLNLNQVAHDIGILDQEEQKLNVY
jgi:hypothetical protein